MIGACGSPHKPIRLSPDLAQQPEAPVLGYAPTFLPSAPLSCAWRGVGEVAATAVKLEAKMERSSAAAVGHRMRPLPANVAARAATSATSARRHLPTPPPVAAARRVRSVCRRQIRLGRACPIADPRADWDRIWSSERQRPAASVHAREPGRAPSLA